MSAIAQALAVSFPKVLNKMRSPENQWAESAFLHELESQKGIVKQGFGPTIEIVLDVKRNPGTAFLSFDLQPLAMVKTEVIQAASYTPGELSVPMLWSKKDEATNSSDVQKVDLVKSLATNGISSHDDALEEALFAVSTSGFLGLGTLVPTNGQGTVGGIDASTEIFWRNQSAIYVDDTDIEAAFTSIYNDCAKGSGSLSEPTLMVSDGATQAIFEGTQQGLQRWSNTSKLNAGFKTLQFKNANYVYSQYGSEKVYFINPKTAKLVVHKEFFRHKGETQEIDNANGYSVKLYSALQFVTGNKSRLGVAYVS